MIYGIDCLGAAAYPDPSVIFNNVPKTWALGVFAEEFGDVLPFLQAAAKAGYRTFRVHLQWDSTHIYNGAHIDRALQLAVIYDKFARNHPHCKVYISPWCENEFVKPWPYFQELKNLVTYCTLVNSSLKNVFIPDTLGEVHGNTSKRSADVYSADGAEQSHAGYRERIQYYKDVDLFFLWAPRLNLHADMHDTTRNSPPDADYIKRLVALV